MLKQAETKALKPEVGSDPDSKGALASPQAKRSCTELEKKLKKFPCGDLQLAKDCSLRDILAYTQLFRNEAAIHANAHPAALVLEILASGSETDRRLHSSQLEVWYDEYAKKRSGLAAFKKLDEVVLRPEAAGSVMHVPLIALAFDTPTDGPPVIEDWLGTFESMFFGGIDLTREPLDVSIKCSGYGGLTASCFDVIKGYTRASVIMTVLIAASELDTNSDSWDMLKPLFPFLDKAWMVSMNVDSVSQSFRNLMLSYRGSERQAPNTLQLALRFSKVMDTRNEQGKHPKHWSTMERLNSVIEEYNSMDGLQMKHAMDEDRIKSVYNIIAGTSAEARNKIANHLNYAKWKESAFSVEQFRCSRWLLGAKPKNCPLEIVNLLTVTEHSQRLHIDLVIHSFTVAGKKLRASSRGKMRASVDDFAKMADFACVYSRVLEKARLLSSWDDKKEQSVMKCFMSRDYWSEIEATITAKLPTFKVEHLAIWSEFIEPKTTSVKLDPQDEVTLQERADTVRAAKFREIRAKVAEDSHRMTAFNTKTQQRDIRTHVVEVMHMKSQNAIGAKLAEEHMDKCASVLMCSLDEFAKRVHYGFTAAASLLEAEKGRDFIVPGGNLWSSNEGRRNLTDQQELAQWLGGLSVPTQILSSLLSDSNKAVIFNPTAYDGTLEKAAIKLGYPVFSTASTTGPWKCAKDMVRDFLMEAWLAWKTKTEPMDKVSPMFKRQPAAEDLPAEVSSPSLTICNMADGRLSIPREIRNEFLGCAVHGPEWRELLSKFDREWSSPTETVAQSHFTGGFCTGSTPPGNKLHEYAGPNSSVSFVITEGPQLWLVAKQSCRWTAEEQGPLVMHGPGIWLVDEKAKKAKDDERLAPRMVFCEMQNDSASVILEAVHRHHATCCNESLLGLKVML
ncbi:unnamed protein product [Symbiodinium sp. CCMP2592]|nr:unnamed protein product [Symbiodinium sp. CCMP2592]